MTKAIQHPANPDQRDDKLDEEEQEILTAYEAGNTTRVEDTVGLLTRHREYAEATFAKMRDSTSASHPKTCAACRNAPWQMAFLIKRWWPASCTSLWKDGLVSGSRQLSFPQDLLHK